MPPALHRRVELWKPALSRSETYTVCGFMATLSALTGAHRHAGSTFLCPLRLFLLTLLALALVAFLSYACRPRRPWMILESDGLRLPELEDLHVPWDEIEEVDVSLRRDLRIRLENPWRVLEHLGPWGRLRRMVVWLLHGTPLGFPTLGDWELPVHVLAAEIEARAAATATPCRQPAGKKKALDAGGAEGPGSPWELHHLQAHQGL